MECSVDGVTVGLDGFLSTSMFQDKWDGAAAPIRDRGADATACADGCHCRVAAQPRIRQADAARPLIR